MSLRHLSSFHPVPLKHLIFALLLICASLFMSSLFTFAAARFTCCCRDYSAGRASRFLLLEQLLCPVCFEHSQGSIKTRWISFVQPTLSHKFVSFRQLSFMPLKAVVRWARIPQAPARLKHKLWPFFDKRVLQLTFCQHLCQTVFE